MKNLLIAVLLIGLGVSLYFNWKCCKGTPSPVANMISIDPSKDSLEVTLSVPKSYVEQADSAAFKSTMQNATKDSTGTVEGSKTISAGGCGDDPGCVGKMKLCCLTPPVNIMPNPEWRRIDFSRIEIKVRVKKNAVNANNAVHK